MKYFGGGRGSSGILNVVFIPGSISNNNGFLLGSVNTPASYVLKAANEQNSLKFHIFYISNKKICDTIKINHKDLKSYDINFQNIII